MKRTSIATVCALGLTTCAFADFFEGQLIDVIGTALDPAGNTVWGTGFGSGGTHALGGFNEYADFLFAGFDVTVTSELVGEGHLSITLDFSDFDPIRFEKHLVDFNGLKFDGTIETVAASQGSIVSNGNVVNWSGLGVDLDIAPIVKIDIYQVPAPGAAVLLLGAAITRRRRR